MARQVEARPPSMMLESAHVPRRRVLSWKLVRKWLSPVLWNVVPPLVALFIAGLVWQLVVEARHTPVYILPKPTVILHRLFGDLGYFAHRGWETLYEAIAGFALATAIAIALAIVMAHSRVVERTLFPIAILVKVMPIVAIAPLLVIWFGFGVWPKISVAALITFFPVLVNAIVGLRSVNPSALDFLRSLDATPLEIFWRLRVPSSLPYLFAAFRISIPLSVIGAVVAEYPFGDRGLGKVIAISYNNLDMPTMFSAIVTLAVIGIGLTVLTAAVERRLVFWHESNLAQ
ncbi:MAG: ABC transporter permease [Chloroflexi bacterium]|nr:ABC transporter permease [Chloroflexota bacterium]